MNRREFMANLALLCVGTPGAIAGIPTFDQADDIRRFVESVGEPRGWRYVLVGNWFEIPLTVERIDTLSPPTRFDWGDLVQTSIQFQSVEIHDSQRAEYIRVSTAANKEIFRCDLVDSPPMVAGGSMLGSITFQMPRPILRTPA